MLTTNQAHVAPLRKTSAEVRFAPTIVIEGSRQAVGKKSEAGSEPFDVVMVIIFQVAIADRHLWIGSFLTLRWPVSHPCESPYPLAE
jgi:hypothetical protein